MVSSVRQLCKHAMRIIIVMYNRPTHAVLIDLLLVALLQWNARLHLSKVALPQHAFQLLKLLLFEGLHHVSALLRGNKVVLGYSP
jgi:hypothetical protein